MVAPSNAAALEEEGADLDLDEEPPYRRRAVPLGEYLLRPSRGRRSGMQARTTATLGSRPEKMLAGGMEKVMSVKSMEEREWMRTAETMHVL